MPSSFPGMDPYLEAHRRDVHARQIVYATDQIHEQRSGPLRARVEERLVVECEAAGRDIYPDAVVFGSAPRQRRGKPMTGVVGLIEPLVIPAPRGVPNETFIEITDRSGEDRLVTVIELMSPSNKGRGATARLYRHKQQEVIDGGANMVEVDLTRAGQREFILPPDEAPPSHRTTFGTCVYRSRGVRYLYPIPLEKPIPPIRVPLQPQDDDVILHLQPLLARVYENGSYDDTDYTRPPQPPLSEADAAWAGRLLSR